MLLMINIEYEPYREPSRKTEGMQRRENTQKKANRLSGKQRQQTKKDAVRVRYSVRMQQTNKKMKQKIA